MLGREYELFEMKPYEKISGMYSRLITLINSMRKLGKKFSNEDVNSKNHYEFASKGLGS